MDSLRQRVPDGAYLVSFRLYSFDIGGVPMWTEDVTVFTDDGIFDAILGNTNPITVGFQQQRWLGISIEGEPELVPRTQLTAAPYAFQATRAESLVGGGGDSDWLFGSGGNIYRLSGGIPKRLAARCRGHSPDSPSRGL